MKEIKIIAFSLIALAMMSSMAQAEASSTGAENSGRTDTTLIEVDVVDQEGLDSKDETLSNGVRIYENSVVESKTITIPKVTTVWNRVQVDKNVGIQVDKLKVIHTTYSSNTEIEYYNDCLGVATTVKTGREDVVTNTDTNTTVNQEENIISWT